MGQGTSKECGGGTLYGAYAPPLQGIPLPKPLDPVEKRYCVTCPPDKKGGDTMIVDIKGREQTILIPKYVVKKIYSDNNGAKIPTKPGDKFSWTNSEWKNVIASTLPSLPGGTTIEAKPMIWASASKTYVRNSNINEGKQVGPMLQVAQQQLLIQAFNVGCNAVSGIKQVPVVYVGSTTKSKSRSKSSPVQSAVCCCCCCCCCFYVIVFYIYTKLRILMNQIAQSQYLLT
jgi:hypothetical protein